MGRNFHHHICDILFLHLAEQCLQFLGFRSRSFCFQNLIADPVFDGTHDTYFAAHSIQNGFHQVCGGCFTVCAGHTNGMHFSGGVSIEIGRCHRQCLTVVFRHDDRYVFGHIFHCVFTQQRSCAFFHRHRDIFVSVCLESCDADKQAVFLYLAGIILDLGNFQFCSSLLYFIRNTFQKLFQFHFYSLLSFTGIQETLSHNKPH